VADDATHIETADVLAVDAAIAQATGSAGFGITQGGFVPKPFARLLAEKLALGRELFDDSLDLGSGSAIRKLLEIAALEDARTWAALAGIYDNSFVASATGEALSRLGDGLGLQRPFLEARGSVRLKLTGTLPTGMDRVSIERGARMLTPGGHHVATQESVVLTPATPEQTVPVVAFYPGPEHNLDPAVSDSSGVHPQLIDHWNPVDVKLEPFLEARKDSGDAFDVLITHTAPLTGGELHWPDDRYRQLLLRAPRSTWTADAIQVAVSLVPGVRQVQVRDAWGGLDINQSIFGDFNFIERMFGSERDLGSPYYLTVLVAPTAAAIWEGPDGLRAAVEAVIEDLRPISIFPSVEEAEEVGIGIAGDLIVRGLPLPTGSSATVNSSQPAIDLKRRLLRRLELYVDNLTFGEPVRAAEAIWALMNEPGIADVREPRLLRYPPGLNAIDLGISGSSAPGPEEFPCGANVQLQVNQIPRFVDDPTRLVIV
jgi:hypothetical protein